jgi:hypothetical protein
MIWKLFRSIALRFSVVVLASSFVSTQARESAPPTPLQIQGLKPEYSSCSQVDFAIRNTSKQDVYVDVYVERFASGSWNDESYPYAINDPASLYSKMVKVDLVKPGEALSLSYNRCLKPKFVKEDEKVFRNAIEEVDAKAEKTGSPTSQRIRVEVHNEARVKVSQKVWSQPFCRKPERSSLGAARN